MIILGIDPGSVTTGYGLIKSSGNRLVHIEGDAIRLKKHSLDMAQRLLYLGETIDALIQTHRPDALSIERVFHGVNFSSALKLGYVRGVILFLGAKHHLEVAEYSPTEVKKALTGYGRAEKTQMQEMVRMLLNLPTVPKPHDVADALALAICHAHTAPYLAKIQKPLLKK